MKKKDQKKTSPTAAESAPCAAGGVEDCKIPKGPAVDDAASSSSTPASTSQ